MKRLSIPYVYSWHSRLVIVYMLFYFGGILFCSILLPKCLSFCQYHTVSVYRFDVIPIKIPMVFFNHWGIKNNPKIPMEPHMKTPSSQSNFEKKEQSWRKNILSECGLGTATQAPAQSWKEQSSKERGTLEKKKHLLTLESNKLSQV